ncbi:uncharacterized protein BCR38DRAFT_409338 [Pseudomassariella vexata]|uniref:Uncharacterized protein n=1 Tax=Pseudomassariella vexata TaxID=1141098 RepID=A0A1Y2DZ61_9PEZI|nr:uncharacterized protein BCR38DRAFT_409338 [Pseudomassariella vexata]ORY63925.1 hypothetical protein BCR38DRAFT_409338 [Pseudomassariella vexata]
MGTKVPDLSACEKFDGSEAASRIRMGSGQIARIKVIRAINILARGDVATYLDSDTKLSEIITRASENQASREDLTTLEQCLKVRYPSKSVGSSILETDDLTRIAQRDDEPLSQYYNASRVSSDRPVAETAPGQETLTSCQSRRPC